MENIEQKIDELLNLVRLQNTLQKNVLDMDEAVLFTGYKKSTLYQKCHKGELPYYKPSGKKAFFKKSDLEAFLLRYRIKSNQEISDEVQNELMRSKKYF